MGMGALKNEHANDCIKFINDSPSPFHAVYSAKVRLEDAGFKRINEHESWSAVQPGGRYYLTRNGSSIIAFAIGKQWKPGNPIAMIGAHTDSPCLRVKPVSKKQNDGFLQVGVETYGGGLWHTWFDRDLSLAGRVMFRDSDGDFASELCQLDRPLLRIPTLAIHLDRQETFSFNKETQLFPIAGLVAAELNRQSQKKNLESKQETDEADEQPFLPLKAVSERHHHRLVELISKDIGEDAKDIVDFELVLYDNQGACLGGVNNELIFSARLDNLMMSYCALQGLIASVSSDAALEDESSIRLIALFDHEEIGSRTAQGADSNLLPTIIRRLSLLRPPNDQNGEADTWEENPTAYEQMLARSFLVSADMAHSVHPNYAAKYESDHRPEMNKGTVIKINANARYATNSPGIVLLQEVAKRAKKPSFDKSSSKSGVPLQLFVVRNDSSCGSTIGPMLSAELGTRTVDLGNAQLSMHSIRETGGAYDVEHSINLFESFFVHFGELGAKIHI